MNKLGQDTGQTDQRRVQEALDLIKIIAMSQPEEKLQPTDLKFYKDITLRACFPRAFKVSGAQLYWLRDIKDKLL